MSIGASLDRCSIVGVTGWQRMATAPGDRAVVGAHRNSDTVRAGSGSGAIPADSALPPCQRIQSDTCKRKRDTEMCRVPIGLCAMPFIRWPPPASRELVESECEAESQADGTRGLDGSRKAEGRPGAHIFLDFVVRVQQVVCLEQQRSRARGPA